MFVGTAIAGVMEEAGFEAVSTGERIPANVAGFRTGARYVRSASKAEPVAADTEGDDDILLTMLAALSESQRRRLVQMIGK